jgi:hypothetical protein
MNISSAEIKIINPITPKAKANYIHLSEKHKHAIIDREYY